MPRVLVYCACELIQPETSLYKLKWQTNENYISIDKVLIAQHIRIKTHRLRR